MAKSAVLTFRLADDVHDALIVAAAAADRPKAWYVERAVLHALRQDGYLPPAPKPVKPASRK